MKRLSVLLIAFFMLLASTNTSFSQTLDQSLTSPSDLSTSINECCPFIAQTFTAGLTGTLAGISVNIQGNSSYNLNVAIHSVDSSGVPTSTVLGSTALNSNSATLSELIIFQETIYLTAGVQYAIVVNYPGAPQFYGGEWSGANGNYYGGGQIFAGSGTSPINWWLSYPDYDLHFQTYVSTAITVTIDINPGGFPNSINPKSKGKIPVAILSTGTFDANNVDPATVRFGATGTEATPTHYALQDVNGDGDIDMILHFNTQDTGIKCGDTSASLSGETFGGQAIEGSDSIKTQKCK